MKALLFGPAGIPISTKGSGSAAGIEQVKELGLGCMELEFVRGVHMGEESARKVNEARKKLGIELSAHGPYYINLNSKEPEKVKASIKRILKTARIGDLCGVSTITFHAGFYVGMEPKLVYSKIKKELVEIVKTLRAENNKVWVRPETTGKGTQFGSLEEILDLSSEITGVLPCVDFSHIHARTNKNNTHGEFSKLLEMIEKKLGKKGLNNMHIHISGIEYTKKGERNHLNLKNSDFKYTDCLKALKEFKCKGLVISESPNLEGDALLMQKEYKKL